MKGYDFVKTNIQKILYFHTFGMFDYLNPELKAPKAALIMQQNCNGDT